MPTMNHYAYVTVDSIEDIEVEVHEDSYGDLHFITASIGQFVLYTTKEQREMLLELATKYLSEKLQDERDDIQIDINFAGGEHEQRI